MESSPSVHMWTYGHFYVSRSYFNIDLLLHINHRKVYRISVTDWWLRCLGHEYHQFDDTTRPQITHECMSFAGTMQFYLTSNVCHLSTILSHFAIMSLDVQKVLPITTHAWSMKVRYVVRFVNPVSDSCSTFIIAMRHAMSSFIKYCNNGTVIAKY